MDIQPKFQVVYTQDVRDFLKELDLKVRTKILYNVQKASYSLDPKLFKKLEGQEIWEFRTVYAGMQYRMLAFWDHSSQTIVVATHGFIKKTQKTPQKEIDRANNIRTQYFNHK
ncbi:MAG: type II toxin-antitoxin system RelE/ParE family toxin [Bacteroidales bacterium]|nr:type II toxin-antitoxin system RelE/ParE family toxin [Bacteroidales bacterium]